MATFNKFNSFSEAMVEGVHDLGTDQFVVALCATANAPVATNTQLSDLTEIASYANLSSRNITTTSSSQTGGTYTLALTDLVLTSTGGSTGPFQYVVVYNDTATNDELVGWVDYGSALTLADGESLTIDFAASTITITPV